MPAIPYLPADTQEPQELVAAIRARRGGELLHLDRMLLHSPAFASGWNSFLGAVRNQLTVPKKLAELAICTVAVLTGANYEFTQHAPEFIRAGGHMEQLDELKKMGPGFAPTTHFNQAERAAIQLAGEMTQSVRVSPETLSTMSSVLDNEQQFMELVGVIAAYNMVARYLVALGIEPE